MFHSFTFCGETYLETSEYASNTYVCRLESINSFAINWSITLWIFFHRGILVDLANFNIFDCSKNTVHYSKYFLLSVAVVFTYSSSITEATLIIREENRTFLVWCFYNTPASIVECFAEYLASVYAAPLNPETYFNYSLLSENFNSIIVKLISPSKVDMAIRKLKNKMTCGDDLVPSFLVEDCRR